MTRFEELLLELPTAPWEWTAVSSNPSVSFQFINRHPQLPWNPVYASRNPSITESDVRGCPGFGWDYEVLCQNPNISLGFITDFIIKPDAVKRINWGYISANPSVGIRDVLDNPTHDWDHQYLSSNPNITSNFILNEGSGFHWDRSLVSANAGITARDIFKSSLKTLFEWDYRTLSTNPNLPIVYVNDNLGRGWNLHHISSKADLVDIQQYRQIKWDAHGLSMNPNITLDYILNHPAAKWHLPSILSNSGVRIDDAVYEWVRPRWNDIRTMESYMSSNETVSDVWIKKNMSNIDWRRLSSNRLS